MNDGLYKKIVDEDSKNKQILDRYIEFERDYGKELFDFTVDDAAETINKFTENEREYVKNVCMRYIEMARDNGYVL